MSLPVAGRLAALRSERRRAPSDAAQAARELLSNLGIDIGDLIAGRPDVRGQTGYVFRWGEWWFEEIRDGGLGGISEKMTNPPLTHVSGCYLIFLGPGEGLDCLP